MLLAVGKVTVKCWHQQGKPEANLHLHDGIQGSNLKPAAKTRKV